MGTRAYVRYVAERPKGTASWDGATESYTESAAAHVTHDGWPAQFIDKIVSLRDADDITNPVGYAAVHALEGTEGGVDTLQKWLLDGDAPVRFRPNWSYEIVVDGRHLTDWQIRVCRGRPPSDGDSWAIDAPLDVARPALEEITDEYDLIAASEELPDAPTARGGRDE
jgi:hypothetical protein